MGCLKPLGAQPVDMWTTQERCPHRPQAHQQQQKRSNDVLHKPDNLTCYLHVTIIEHTICPGYVAHDLSGS